MELPVSYMPAVQQYLNPGFVDQSTGAQQVIHPQMQMHNTEAQAENTNEEEECKQRKKRASKYDVSNIVNNPVPVNAPNQNQQTDPNGYILPDPALDLKVSKSRTVFTDEQTVILEAAYRKDDHPDTEQRNMVAQMCGLSEECVRVWYQNRKARAKRMEEDRLAALIQKPTDPATQNAQDMNNGMPAMTNKFNSSLTPNQAASQPITGRVVDKAMDHIFASKNKTDPTNATPDEKKVRKKRSPNGSAKSNAGGKRKRKTISEEEMIRNIIREKTQPKTAPIPNQPAPQQSIVYSTPSSNNAQPSYQNQSPLAQPQTWPAFPAQQTPVTTAQQAPTQSTGPGEMSPEQMKNMISYQQNVIMSMQQRMMMGGQMLPWGTQLPSPFTQGKNPMLAANLAVNPFQQMFYNPMVPAMPLSMYQTPQLYDSKLMTGNTTDYNPSPYAPVGTDETFPSSDTSHLTTQCGYSPVPHYDESSRSSSNQEEANIQQAYAAASATGDPQSLSSISSFAEAMATASYDNMGGGDTATVQQWNNYASPSEGAPAAFEQVEAYSSGETTETPTATESPSNPELNNPHNWEATDATNDNPEKACEDEKSPEEMSNQVQISEEHVAILEGEFQKDSCPDLEKLNSVAQMTGLPLEIVQAWYDQRNDVGVKEEETAVETTAEPETAVKEEGSSQLTVNVEPTDEGELASS